MRFGRARCVLLACLLLSAEAVAQDQQPPTLAAEDPVDGARRLFQAGKFTRGLELLQRDFLALRQEPARYARVLAALADFRERYAGDFSEARRLLRLITSLGLPPDHPRVRSARRSLARLQAQAARYSKESAVLDRVSVESFDPDVCRARVAELEALIAGRTDFPGLASAHYYLGKHLLVLQRKREAYRAFDRALELRPALGFHLPVEDRRASVRKGLLRQDLLLAARWTLGLLLLLGALLFLLSRPWRCLGPRHWALLVGLSAAWWLFFRGMVWLGGELVFVPPRVFPRPVYLFSQPASPMSDALDALFWYGLVGVVGVFVIGVSCAAWRRRWARVLVSVGAASLLMAGLMTVFYLNHCDVVFRPRPAGRLAALRGNFYYATPDQEPFLLTDPLAYCKFQRTIDELDEEQIREWFRRHARLCQARRGD